MHSGHLVVGAAALAVALAINTFTANQLVKRKLRLSLFLLGLYVLVNAVLVFRPDLQVQLGEKFGSVEKLGFSAALINLLVTVLLNPLRQDRIPDRFPSILQDAVVLGLLMLVATFVFDEQLLTTSAVSAVVVGFALQDTLGNAFAGLAIQSEKPFRIGDWVRVGEFEGRIAEVTWRATKIRTKAGNFVIVPNNVIGKEAIINYSSPALPTRLEVEVGATYLAAPNEVKAAVYEAIDNAKYVLTAPRPDVLLVHFDSSAITYRARFWIDDFEKDEIAKNEVRTAIYYSFARHGIEIPWPIQVGYHRQWPGADADQKEHEREALLASVDLLASLTHDQRRHLAAGSVLNRYGNGDAIVRQGQPGDSMYIICSGGAIVVLEGDGPSATRHEVARLETGGYFGEMSLLTGEPRSATVIARGDTSVLEIRSDLFRQLAAANPSAVEQIGVAAMTRRTELEAARAAVPGAAVSEGHASFLSRMKRFLGMR
jgi:small-conductance mechanosensitive channel/CRP-like cAMP-binding protein